MRADEFVAEQPALATKTVAQQRLDALKQQAQAAQKQVKRERAQQAMRKAQKQMKDSLTS